MFLKWLKKTQCSEETKSNRLSLCANEEFELSFMNGVEGLPWIATLICSIKTKDSHFKSQVSWMAIMQYMLSVSKEAFTLISTAELAAVVGMDIQAW